MVIYQNDMAFPQNIKEISFLNGNNGALLPLVAWVND